MATIEAKIDNAQSEMTRFPGVPTKWLPILYDILDDLRTQLTVVHETFYQLDAAAAGNACTQKDLSGVSEIFSFLGEASPDFPRNVKVTGTQMTGVTAMTVTVTGTDQFGNTQTEQHSITTASKTSTGNIAFATVTAIECTAITGTGNAGDLCDVGYQTKIGLCGNLNAAADLIKVTEDGSDTGVGDLTLDTTYNTVIFESAPDGSVVFEIWYKILNGNQ